MTPIQRDAALGVPPRTIRPGDPVAVTGASGFIGSAIVRALLQRGGAVTAVVEPGVDRRNLDGLNVRSLEADVTEAESLRRAVAGARLVFHTAARYRFSARDREGFYRVNVAGTRNLLEAARSVGAELVVYTSSVATVRLGHGDGLPDERSFARVDELHGAYKQSKYVAEHEALRAAAEGVPVVVCQPTTPLGPGDRAPTPTGRIVVDYLNGRMPGWFETTLNVVDVDDVASGHLLAAERGALGRSYILGGENWSFRAVLSALAASCGLDPPRRRVPSAVAYAAAFASELVEGRLLGRTPHVPLEGVRMATVSMACSDDRARRELGYRSRPATEAIERAVRWFCANGYVRPSRLQAMRLGQPTS